MIAGVQEKTLAEERRNEGWQLEARKKGYLDVSSQVGI
jgi:hypothetical protein